MSLWLQIICACANLKHAANSWFMKTEGLAQNSGRLWNYGIARSDRGGEYLVSCALCIIVRRVNPVFVILTKKYCLCQIPKVKTLSADKIQSNICKFHGHQCVTLRILLFGPVLLCQSSNSGRFALLTNCEADQCTHCPIWVWHNLSNVTGSG